MKTKIKTISPDQNIIEHESGLKTVFNSLFGCCECIYMDCELSVCKNIPCTKSTRLDKTSGHFTKLLEP